MRSIRRIFTVLIFHERAESCGVTISYMKTLLKSIPLGNYGYTRKASRLFNEATQRQKGDKMILKFVELICEECNTVTHKRLLNTRLTTPNYVNKCFQIMVCNIC